MKGWAPAVTPTGNAVKDFDTGEYKPDAPASACIRTVNRRPRGRVGLVLVQIASSTGGRLVARLTCWKSNDIVWKSTTSLPFDEASRGGI